MLSFEILGARYDEDNDRIEIIKEITDDDGTTHMNLHVFSSAVLECRAAEYGIEDIDTLIDLVIHEPFISSTDVYRVPENVARDVHLQKISEAKTIQKTVKSSKSETKTKLINLGMTQKYLDAIDSDYKDVIRSNCKLDKEVIDMNKDYVAKERTTFASKEVPTQKIGKRNVSELRKKLLRESEIITEAKNASKIEKDSIVNSQDNKSNHVKMIMRGGKIVKE